MGWRKKSKFSYGIAGLFLFWLISKIQKGIFSLLLNKGTSACVTAIVSGAVFILLGGGRGDD